ncbi:hypothetical protein BGZ97_005308 [Linnemannia gamsii]|uniref:Cas12f1-like TNB domain-containing protein n=1 Tax=Linnemannia gamsii TaxID=64522 RepID=A0A9P6USC3_9FUNG|nr:hypothetical protein BGZ97_005308 [Linnemannia gamsii]
MASGLYDMEDDDIDEFRLDAPFLDHRIPSSFDTQTGTFLQAPEIGETLHQEGYTVVGVPEFYTSAKCPRPDCDCFLMPNKHRSRYCSNCEMYVDRDQAGSEYKPAGHL